MYRDHTIIVSICAGRKDSKDRKDRMRLLMKHVEHLVAKNMVDEVHLWDCTNNSEATLLTTSDEYVYADGPAVTGSSYTFKVRGAENDVSLLLTTPLGTEYELVIGGWNNTRSVFREGKQNVEEVAVNTEIRLQASEWTTVTLNWENTESLNVTVGQFPEWSVPFVQNIQKIQHATGWGSSGTYEFPDSPDSVYKYCMQSSSASYYKQYAATSLSKPTVLIKAANDIVCLGSASSFQAFLDFCLDNPQYSLVFPNIVNHGLCAFYQKQKGLLDTVDGLEEDAAPRFGGALWESADRARQVHEAFLDNPEAFSYEGFAEIPPHHRVSITMYAVLLENSRDLFKTCSTTKDDEQFLTEIDRGTKAVFFGYSAAHYSFYTQEEGLKETNLLERYAARVPLSLVKKVEEVVENEVKIPVKKGGRKKKVVEVEDPDGLPKIKKTPKSHKKKTQLIDV